MLKFSEIFEFSKEKFRKIPILKEFEWFEWFEWFGPSPIEPFNSAAYAKRRTSRSVSQLRVSRCSSASVARARYADPQNLKSAKILPAETSGRKNMKIFQRRSVGVRLGLRSTHDTLLHAASFHL